MPAENDNPVAVDAIMNAQIEAVKKKYEPRIKALQQDGEQLKNDAPDPSKVEAVINVDFEVHWTDRAIIFNLPEMTVRDKRIVLDVPEVKMQLERIVFDVPAVRMVRKVVGRKPEIHGFTIRWTDIIISVPETYMHRHEVKMDIPSVTMKRNEIIVGIPEFKMKELKWIVRLPEFKVTKVSAATDRLKDAAKKMSDEAEAIKLAMTAEINELLGKFMGGDNAIASTVMHHQMVFDSAIKNVQSAIDMLVKKGVDPIKVPTDGGHINLRKTLEQLLAMRDKMMQDLEALAATAEPEAKLAA